MSLSNDILYNLIGSNILNLIKDKNKSMFSTKRILNVWNIDEEHPIFDLGFSDNGGEVAG